MKKSVFKKIIAVLFALATLILAGCQNNESVNEDNLSENISQNDVVNQEENTQREETSNKDETKPTEKEETKDEETAKKEETTKNDGKKNYISDYIAKTDNWKTEGLKKYGLNNFKIIDSKNSSYGKVYYIFVSTDEYTGIGYLAIETKDKVWLEKTSKSYGLDYLNAVDIDGEKGDEIVLSESNGGSAQYNICTVWKITSVGVKEFSEIPVEGIESCLIYTLADDYKMTVTNYLDTFETTVDISDCKELLYDRIYDEKGKLIEENADIYIEYEGFNSFKAADLDGDGTYEIIAKQYCAVLGLQDIGNAVTVLKYDNEEEYYAYIDVYLEVK